MNRGELSPVLYNRESPLVQPGPCSKYRQPSQDRYIHYTGLSICNGKGRGETGRGS